MNIEAQQREDGEVKLLKFVDISFSNRKKVQQIFIPNMRLFSFCCCCLLGVHLTNQHYHLCSLRLHYLQWNHSHFYKQFLFLLISPITLISRNICCHQLSTIFISRTSSIFHYVIILSLYNVFCLRKKARGQKMHILHSGTTFQYTKYLLQLHRDQNFLPLD